MRRRRLGLSLAPRQAFPRHTPLPAAPQPKYDSARGVSVIVVKSFSTWYVTEAMQNRLSTQFFVVDLRSSLPVSDYRKQQRSLTCCLTTADLRGVGDANRNLHRIQRPVSWRQSYTRNSAAFFRHVPLHKAALPFRCSLSDSCARYVPHVPELHKNIPVYHEPCMTPLPGYRRLVHCYLPS